MALIIYPNDGYDSFISLADADALIASRYPLASKWVELTDSEREVYLRLHCNTILTTIDKALLPETAGCLAKANGIMAYNDVIYDISITVDRNNGLITKEKVGDVEVNYQQYRSNLSKKSVFNVEVKQCLGKYGAVFSNLQVTLGKS
jgi:hypothetical protein